MKKFFILAALFTTLSVQPSKAQSIAQLTTQLVLDIQKLSYLKDILSDMYQAYTVIDKGYSDIKDIVSGNFNLHKAFLDGLLAISPAVKNYAKVVDIVNAEFNIATEYKGAISKFQSAGYFTQAEVNYIGVVYSTIFNHSLQCIDRLTMVLTANQLRMSDAERLAAIDHIYDDVEGELSQLRSFNNTTSVQVIQRAKEAGDIGTLQSIYGIQK